ncbi:MAG: hypothetical protein JNN15_21560 [Blastocatellia bacterium]|nr:hypothetical protein [Blastocatellia bacterium]
MKKFPVVLQKSVKNLSFFGRRRGVSHLTLMDVVDLVRRFQISNYWLI